MITDAQVEAAIIAFAIADAKGGQGAWRSALEAAEAAAPADPRDAEIARLRLHGLGVEMTDLPITQTRLRWEINRLYAGRVFMGVIWVSRGRWFATPAPPGSRDTFYSTQAEARAALIAAALEDLQYVE